MNYRTPKLLRRAPVVFAFAIGSGLLAAALVRVMSTGEFLQAFDRRVRFP